MWITEDVRISISRKGFRRFTSGYLSFLSTCTQKTPERVNGTSKMSMRILQPSPTLSVLARYPDLEPALKSVIYTKSPANSSNKKQAARIKGMDRGCWM
jgi:hypothetical protein